MLYDDIGLPCHCKVKSSDGTTSIKGVYHHLTHEHEDEFIKVLVTKLEELTFYCIHKKASGGTVLR